MSEDVRDRLAALLPESVTVSKYGTEHVRVYGMIHDPEAAALADTLDQAARDKARIAELEAAVAEAKDLCWKATPYGRTTDDDVLSYIVPKGAVHRLVGALQCAGVPAALRNPAWDDKEQPAIERLERERDDIFAELKTITVERDEAERKAARDKEELRKAVARIRGLTDLHRYAASPCTCGTGGEFPHEPYCGIDPVDRALDGEATERSLRGKPDGG